MYLQNKQTSSDVCFPINNVIIQWLAITTVNGQGARAQFPIAFTTSYKISGMCDNNGSGGWFHTVIWYDKTLTESYFACIGHGDFYAGSADIIMIGY